MTYTRFLGGAFVEKAFACARGDYQRQLLNGNESWAGSTLRGKARMYNASYWRSRNSLLVKLTEAGIPHHFEYIERRKVLMIGEEK